MAKSNNANVPEEFEALRTITIDVDPWEDNIRKVFKALSPIRVGSKSNAGTGSEMEAPEILRVLMLNGEEKDIMLGSLLHDSLTRAYPNDSYVGKWFIATRLPKEKSKRYHKYICTEIAAPKNAPAEA